MATDKANGVPPGSELAVLQGQVVDIAVYRAPEAVLDEARKAAVALQDVISNKKDPVMMNGQQYLEYEDWQTVGRFYHVTAKVEKTEFVQYGAVRGFSASAVALRSDGAEISRAEADCLSDEPKWSSKPKYEWHDKAGGGRERVQVGEEPVPLFQLKSMAQTRACAKALRNVLAWVVVLAGYRPTPAEELEREREHEKPAGQGRSADAEAAQPSADGEDKPTKVKEVSKKNGTNARGPWTRYLVKFMDGRMGGTFSKSDGEHAERAAASDALVRPRLKKTDKGWDLDGFDPLTPAKAEEAHPKPEHDEPIAGPEKILTLREAKTDQGVRWHIQTDKRVVITDDVQHLEDAKEARAMNFGLTPRVEVLKSHSGRPFNRLLGWAETSKDAKAAAQGAETAAPAAQAAAEEPQKAPAGRKPAAKRRARQPGDDDA